MKKASEQNLNGRARNQATGGSGYLTVKRTMLAMWFCMGLAPLLLQTRSYVKFATPHKINWSLVVPSGVQKETANLTELCPLQGFLLAGVWWNSEVTHYYNTDHGRLCHSVTPQYNLHGNYFIGFEKVEPFESSPSNCADNSYLYQQYLYHGSIGYYSFYEAQNGTYCASHKTAYITTEVIGSFDINGEFLAEDTGSNKDRMSFWYGIVGASWLFYRVLVLRRSFITCMRYGHKCDEMGEKLPQKETMVFVQESLRLSAQGATNYHRVALLYLIIEGIMTDLFLLIANDGLATKIQYASLGYNLSGLMLLMFEIVENTRFVSEKMRQLVMRLVFSYETALLGELVTAGVLQHFLSGLNESDLKRSKSTALAVSYYFWSLICHAIVVIVILLIIISVRSIIAVLYVWANYRSMVVFTEPCCVDTVFGVRGRIAMLGGYRFENGKLYYKLESLKAFGLLRMEECGVEYLALPKLHWFAVPRDNLFLIGVITGDRVEPCNERPCSGIVSFIDRGLGGPSDIQVDRRHIRAYRDTGRVLAVSENEISYPA